MRGPRITLELWSLAGAATDQRGWRGPDAPQECGVGVKGSARGAEERRGSQAFIPVNFGFRTWRLVDTGELERGSPGLGRGVAGSHGS